MDVNRLTRGQQIAGISGIALFIIMFLDWFKIDTKGVSASGIDTGLSAWQSFSFIDIVLFITILAALALALIAASQTTVNLPVALSSIVTGLGALSLLLIIFRIIFQPSIGVLGVDIDTNPSYGVFLGLIAAAALTYGGYLAMQEEGTSFGTEADRLRGPGDGPGRGPGAGPPSPPPPPPGSTPPGSAPPSSPPPGSPPPGSGP